MGEIMKRGYEAPQADQSKTPNDLLARRIPRETSQNLSYFREARFFLGKNRATLTYYAGSEVASIHYDLLRDEIFLKGHNVKNMTLTEEQWLSLQHFADYLSESEAKSLLQSYQNCLDQLMLRRMKTP